MAWLVSLKILLISSGVVALGLAMKLYVPLVYEFLVSNFPLIWSSISSCKSLLRPPYLYVVVNAIIITIAASSMFHHDRPSDESKPTPPEPAVYVHHREEVVMPRPVVYEHKEEEEEEEEEDVKSAVVEYEHKDEAVVKEVTSVVFIDGSPEPAVVLIDGAPEPAVAQVDRDLGNETELELSSDVTWMIRKTNEKKLDDIVLPASKPLVSTRFSHRKPARSTPEGGRPLRVVSKAPKRVDDTLENTWKAITEGRSIPLSRHIKKSDTWNNHGRGEVNVDAMSTELDNDMSAAVHKSKTFKDLTNQQQALALTAVSSSSPAGVRLRKEPSLGQDELNRRVEAFIHKFNEDMRLQRQESLNQYMEMINRGSH